MAEAASTVCDDCCPEAVSEVTINNNTLDPDQSLSLTVANVGGAGGTTTITAQVQNSLAVDVEGNFEIHMWFVDSNSKTANKTAIPPSTPGAVELNLVTEDDGKVEVAAQHSGALAEWYVCASLWGIVYIAGPIDLGT